MSPEYGCEYGCPDCPKQREEIDRLRAEVEHKDAALREALDLVHGRSCGHVPPLLRILEAALSPAPAKKKEEKK